MGRRFSFFETALGRDISRLGGAFFLELRVKKTDSEEGTPAPEACESGAFIEAARWVSEGALVADLHNGREKVRGQV